MVAKNNIKSNNGRNWKKVIDFTKINKGGIELEFLLKLLHLERRADNTYKKLRNS